MNEENFRGKVKDLLEHIASQSTPEITRLMQSGCGFKEDVENSDDNSYLVAKAFVISFIRSYADVWETWASSKNIKELVDNYTKF